MYSYTKNNAAAFKELFYIMKLEQAHIDQITTAFKKMQSKEDLLHLLNEAKPLVYGAKAVPFELKQLTWYANPKLGGKRYAEFKIKKKSGAARSIHAPVKGLKSLQKTLSFVLQCVFEPHHAAMGFVRDKSIVDNARLHEASKYVYNIDLKDFFPSVDQARVWKCFQLKPFNLTDSEMASEEENTTRLQTGVRKFVTDHKERIYYKIQDNSLILVIDKKENYRKYKKRLTGHLIKPNVPLLGIEAGDREKLREYNREVNEIIFEDAKRYILSTENIEALNRLVSSRKNLANIIASLCCTEMEVERKNATGEWEKVKRNVLPQGAPTSPVITNIVCQRLDHLLSGVARRFGLKYSRYADDITFSSMHNVYQPESDFLKELRRIILEQGFHIKESKTRLQKDGYRKEVTGLLVNEKANVQQRYIKQLRMWLHRWEIFGYHRAAEYFIKDYSNTNLINGQPRTENKRVDRWNVKEFASGGKKEKKKRLNMDNVIAGKLDYLKMVKGSENPMYIKLKDRFDLLTGNPIKVTPILKEAITTKSDSNHVKITLEVYQSPELNEKLKSSINIPKDTVLPSTLILANSISQSKSEKIIVNNLYPIIHTPSKTVELLKYFTANDKDLKYSTHSWEEEKYNSYEEYMDKIRQEWKEINEELKKQSSRLHAKISNFLFNDKLGQKNEIGYHISWGEKRLKFGWSSPEVKVHMNELGNSPFSCKIPDHVKELDKKHGLFYFKDYAEIFKNEIEFREDSKNFKKIILELKKSELLNDFNIVGFDNLVGFSFFTDVHYVKEVIRIIFGEMFKKRPEFPNILTERMSDFHMGFHLIRITQKDSYVTREFSDNKISNPSGDLIKIIDSMRNLGDYSIMGRFGDGKNYRINYLTSSKMPFIENLSNSQKVEGFTHEFKFYL